MGRIKEILLTNEELIEENRILRDEITFLNKLNATIVYISIASVFAISLFVYWIK